MACRPAFPPSSAGLEGGQARLEAWRELTLEEAWRRRVRVRTHKWRRSGLLIQTGADCLHLTHHSGTERRVRVRSHRWRRSGLLIQTGADCHHLTHHSGTERLFLPRPKGDNN